MSDIDDRERGLYRKYEVYRVKEDDHGNVIERYQVTDPFFVLKARDPHAIAAVRAYSAACEREFSTLAAELAVMADRWEAEQNRPRIICCLCRRERTIRDAYDYSPLQVLTGQPLGWYSGDDGEVCPECMSKSQAGQW